MTYEEAVKSDKPFNRKKYKDGWYNIDDRGYTCHIRDLSIRCPAFTEEDKKATDWHVWDGKTLTEIRKQLREQRKKNDNTK